MNDENVSPTEIQVGNVIEVPEWGAVGMVHEITTAMYGSDEARSVLIQEYAEQPASRWKWYRLERGEFWILE